MPGKFRTALRKSLLVLASVLLMLSFLLLVLILKGKQSIRKARQELSSDQHPQYRLDDKLGYHLQHQTTFTWADVTHRRRDSVYIVSTDEFGRREVPEHPSADRHWLFFGCSYTFGDRVDQPDVFPYRIAERDSSLEVANYGMSGYSTSHMLALLEDTLQNEIANDKGLAVYVYIKHHNRRNVMDPHTLQWGYDFPEYRLDERDHLYYAGSFYEQHPVATALFKAINESKFRNYSGRLYSILYPGSSLLVTDEQYHLLAKIASNARDRYLEQFPGGRFVVLIFPGEENGVIPFLKEVGLEVIDLSSALDLPACECLQEDGYHPNAEGHRLLADTIYQRLIQFESGTDGL